MKVPFVDLKCQFDEVREQAITAACRVLESGVYALGPEVEAFEQAFAAYCKMPYAVAVNSGTAALHIALVAAGIGEGDEVITVAMTFPATVAAIQYAGARPVVIDIDPVTWTMDPQALAEAVTTRTRAVFPVHLHGLMADMDPILEIARRHGLTVIEDAAQAHGAHYKGRGAGSLGTLGCFSFYPTKNLGAFGEGGAVVTADSTLAARLRALRDWGQETAGTTKLKGFNARMDALQGALLAVKLPRLEAWNETRRRIAARYDSALAGLPITCPSPPVHCRHVYHHYAVRIPHGRRDAIKAALAKLGIGTAIHYAKPVHLQPAYGELGEAGAFPQSETAADEFLSLPVYPGLGADQFDFVCRALQEILGS